MKPNNCPKFDSCSVPICPLDVDWRLRTHLKGDRVCPYLLESVKNNAQANFEGVLPSGVYAAVVSATPDILARWNPIRKAAKRASETGSRIAAGRRLGTARASPESLDVHP